MKPILPQPRKLHKLFKIALTEFIRHKREHKAIYEYLFHAVTDNYTLVGKNWDLKLRALNLLSIQFIDSAYNSFYKGTKHIRGKPYTYPSLPKYGSYKWILCMQRLLKHLQVNNL